MITAARRPQAIRLLPTRAAWKRAGLFLLGLVVLLALSWILTITMVEVLALAARIAP